METIDLIAEFRERLAALGEPRSAAECALFRMLVDVLRAAQEARATKSDSLEFHNTATAHGLLMAAEIYRHES